MTITLQHTPTTAEAVLAVHIAVAARALSLGGHDDFNQGQVSARLPGSSVFFIKSAMVGFDECTPADVIAASVDHTAPADPLAPPELPLHQAAYALRPDVNAVVHSHAPHTLVFGATDLPLRAISHDGAYFEGRLPRFTGTSNTILDIETGLAVARSLGSEPAVLLRNRGGVVVDKNLRRATVSAQLLERACELQLLAEGSRAAYHTSSVTDVSRKLSFIYADLSMRSYWEWTVRRVARHWPGTEAWLTAARASSR